MQKASSRDDSSPPPDPDDTVRVACWDAGANVLFMGRDGAELVLWLSAERELRFKPRMDDLYMNIMRVLKKSTQ